jgi:hypothetical protein
VCVTVRTQSVTERDATSCPFDLVQKAKEAGLVASLVKRLKAKERDVIAVAEEFVEFWTVHRGGQAQRNWLVRLGDWIERKHRSGELHGAAGAENESEDPATEQVKLHPRAAERLARQQAEATRVQAELAAELKDAPARDVDALLAGIGGRD